jgi:type I restriction enzyme R subunit
LPGIDSPPLNVPYVDKNLKFHGLIQAYSRTNRILNEQKSQGNIIVFRNLKKVTDEALALIKGQQPSVLHRKTISERILDKVMKFVEIFVNGLDS